MYYGEVVGDDIRCRYHGLLFGPEGNCTENPDGSKPPPMCLKKYPVQEVDDMIWVWIGDEEPDSEVPSIVGDSRAEPFGGFINGYLRLDCKYTAIVENLVDNSHAPHLHEMLRSEAAIKNSVGKTTDNGSSIQTVYDCPNAEASDLFKGLYDTKGKNVDQRITITWHDPSIVTVYVDAVTTGGDYKDGLQTTAVHILVPESEGRGVHYFWCQARNLQKDNQELSEKIAAGLAHIFVHDDGWIIEGQEKMMEGSDFWDLKPAMLPQDKPTVMVRRRMDSIIDEQRA
jgi:vanillate O-demethylase monooxygenase subunit